MPVSMPISVPVSRLAQYGRSALSQVVQMETVGPGQTLADLRRFPPLNELVVAAHGPQGKHGDFGEVRAYLEERGMGDIFVKIFGVD